MKAVILAAGEGQRMRPLTLTTPKPLLPINGKPIIDYILDSLPAEVDEVIIVIKYLGEQIKAYIGSINRAKKIRYVLGSDKGSAYSFMATQKYLHNERFLIVNGDELTHPTDINNCIKHDLSILTFESKDPSTCGMAYLRADGTIKKIIEKPKKTKSKLAVNGVMVLNTDIFDYRPKPEHNEFYFSTLVGCFVRDHRVIPVKAKKSLFNITAPRDLIRVEKILKKRSD